LDALILNSEVDWDTFDSDEYRNHNYQTVRDDDGQIVRLIRNFFAKAGVEHGRGIDVGPGANLYPALAMLPFCRRLDLREFSASNVKWLNQQIDEFDQNWDAFWSIYRQRDAYTRITDPRVRLRRISVVEQASVFDLPEGRWDLGTMFFVACSISTDMTEFKNAVHSFVRCLRRNAPFAAAFMSQSRGYWVGDTWFPAVPIGSADVKECLQAIAKDVHIEEIETRSPLRDDHHGMIVATGRAAG